MIEKWDDEIQAPVPVPRFCENCGSPRSEGARFCPGCGRAFGAASTPLARAEQTQPAPLVSPAQPAATSLSAVESAQTSSGRTFIYIGGVLLVTVLGLVLLSKSLPTQVGGNQQNPPGGQVDTPPVGQAWFGDSFNTTTLAVNNRKTTVGTNQAFAAVFHLTSTQDGSKMALRMYLDGQLVANNATSNTTGTSDVWGFNLGPLYEAGTWRFELTDIGGNVLASGSITAH